MIILYKAVVLTVSVFGSVHFLQTMRTHHSAVCHRCGGKGFYNGSICPDCMGDGKYHAGKDRHEHHYDFSADDKATDLGEPDDGSDREFNA